jgi:CubicO group peptidase (beta-lactamase class C family)
MILSHRSGVVCLDHSPITAQALKEHTPIAEALAAASPQWEPDTAHGYHAVTFGHLVSELIRRRTGATVGQFFAKEIAAPLGLDCYISIPNPDTVHLATMQQSKAEELMAGGEPGRELPILQEMGKPESITYRASVASISPDLIPDVTTEDPSYGGYASAQSMARFFAALIGDVDGFRLLSPALREEIPRVLSRGRCLTTVMPTAWGLGFMVADSPVFPLSAGLGMAFGFDGANGTFTFADPVHGLAFAYVQNAGSSVLCQLDERARPLVQAAFRGAGKV